MKGGIVLIPNRASFCHQPQKRGLGRGPGSLTGPRCWERRARLLCLAPVDRAHRLGLDLVAKLDPAKGCGLDLPSSPRRAQPLQERVLPLPLDAPQSGGGQSIPFSAGAIVKTA